MKLTFLGTGTSQGVPVITCRCPVCTSSDPHDQRLRTSALVTADSGDNILIDIGPDFRTQMLREDVSHIEGILVTHAHRDHVAGLDDVRAFNYQQNCRMNLYSNDVAIDILHRDYAYMFEYHPYPGAPQVDLHLVGDQPFRIGAQSVVPIRAMHLHMPILGYRLDGLTYITDASKIETQELDKVKGTKVLVINALRKEKHFSHFCLSEALQVVEIVRPERTYLTHMSHDFGLHAVEQLQLPSNVYMAYDGLTIEI